MSTILAVDKLVTGYTHAPILHELTLSIETGQCVGVLGANGAGKTTLLRAVSGTLKVWRGELRFEGEDLRKVAPWNRVRKGIAHVPEGRRVFGAMTVEENLQVAALVRKGAKNQISEAYDLFPRLGGRRKQLAQTLSGGEQQMLSIARGLMTKPKLLMIDEMSAGLAPAVAESLIDDLASIRKTGVSLLLIEQNPVLISDIVEYVFLIEHGTTVAAGTLAELGGAEAIGQRYVGVSTDQTV